MKKQTMRYLVAAFILATTAALHAGSFEDTVAVRVQKGLRGPRGMPGDIVQLRDGSLLMSYTRDGSIMGIKSLDKGKT